MRNTPKQLLAAALASAFTCACGSNSTDGGAGDLAGQPAGDMAMPTVDPVVHQMQGVTVSTLAGSDQPGAMDGAGTAARFNNPVGVATDPSGVVYVTEYDGARVRSIDAAGMSHTIVSTGGAHKFTCPFGIAVSGANQLVVETDCDPTGAKNKATGTLWRVDVTVGMPTPVVQGLGRPRGLTSMSGGAVGIADHTVQTVSMLGATATDLLLLAGVAGNPGFSDGAAATAQFNNPYGVAQMPDGRLVVADANNARLRAVTSSGEVSTFAGGPGVGTVDAQAMDARFDSPMAVASDAAGNVFVSDRAAHRIRRVATDGTVMSVAGNGVLGFADGSGETAQFYGQEGIAVSADGKRVFVTDGNGGDGSNHHRIRLVLLP